MTPVDHINILLMMTWLVVIYQTSSLQKILQGLEAQQQLFMDDPPVG
jgi:hypothetical protein